MDKELSIIMDDYIADFESKKALPFVVKNSVPIIWFGNIERYFASPKKVITIAINPSSAEFSENRFPEALKNFSKENLYKSLNAYFECNPYNIWFNRYEKVLNCVNATYGGKTGNIYSPNTAISVDLFTHIATNPKWSSLSSLQKMQITEMSLFEKIYGYLSPDVVFISINRKDAAEHFKFCSLKKLTPADTDGKIEIYDGGKTKIVFGRNMRGTVFGGTGNSIEAINTILKKYNI